MHELHQDARESPDAGPARLTEFGTDDDQDIRQIRKTPHCSDRFRGNQRMLFQRRSASRSDSSRQNIPPPPIRLGSTTNAERTEGAPITAIVIGQDCQPLRHRARRSARRRLSEAAALLPVAGPVLPNPSKLGPLDIAARRSLTSDGNVAIALHYAMVYAEQRGFLR